MFQSFPTIFENLGPFSFSALFAYIGLVLGMILALLLWFRHLLRYNRTQKQKRRLNAEYQKLAAENQSLNDRLSWFDNRKTALDTMEESVAKEATAKLAKRQQENKSGAHSGSIDSSRGSVGSGTSSTSGSMTQAAGFSSGSSSSSGTGQFDWESLDGVTPKTAAQLKSLGIRDVAHLESLSPSERESLESKLAFEGQGWNWNWLNKWKTGAAGLAAGAAGVAGLGFAGSQNNKPEVDWSKVDGVDPKMAAELSSSGIKNVEQLESLSDADRQKLQAQMESKGISLSLIHI